MARNRFNALLSSLVCWGVSFTVAGDVCVVSEVAVVDIWVPTLPPRNRTHLGSFGWKLVPDLVFLHPNPYVYVLDLATEFDVLVACCLDESCLHPRDHNAALAHRGVVMRANDLATEDMPRNVIQPSSARVSVLTCIHQKE